MSSKPVGIETIPEKKRVEIPDIQEKYTEMIEKFRKEFKKSEIFSKVKVPRLKSEDSTFSINSNSFKRKMQPETITAKFLYQLLESIGIDTYDLYNEWNIEFKDVTGKKMHTYVDLVIPKGQGTPKGLLIEIEPIGKNLYYPGSGLWQVQKWFTYDSRLKDQYYGLATNLVDWFFYNPIKNEVHQETPKKALRIIADIYLGERVIIKTQERVEKFYTEFNNTLKNLKDSLNSKEPKILGLSKSIDDSEKEQIIVSFYRTIFSRMIFLRILFDWRLLDFNADEIFKLDESLYKNAFDQLFFRVLNLPQSERPPDIMKIFKDVPYLNGGLFRPSFIETDTRTRNIRLLPQVYKMIWDILSKYSFFDQRDEESLRNENIIDPEVLGNIFEKTVSTRKGTGSYYTRDEITRYVAHNAVTKTLLSKLRKISIIKKLGLSFQTLDFRYLDNGTQIIDGEDVVVKRYLAEQLLKELERIRICDNAVGSGAFLIAVGEKLVSIYKTMYRILNYNLPHYETEDDSTPPLTFSNIYDIKKFILQNNLFGVDIQYEAIELCELRLWLWLVRPPTNLTPSKYKLEPLPNIDYNIRTGNTLIGYTNLISFKTKSVANKTGEKTKKTIPLDEFFYNKLANFQSEIKTYYNLSVTKEEDIKKLKSMKENLYAKLNKKYIEENLPSNQSMDSFIRLKPFHWIIDFYPIMEKGGFDIIIGNPPYVRGENVKHLTDDYQIEFKSLLAKAFGGYKLPSTADLAMYFIIRSLEIIRNSGYHSYIVTDKWLRSSYGELIRKLLAEKTSLLKSLNLAHLPDVFVGITVVTMIYSLRKLPPPSNHRVFYNQPSSFNTMEDNGYYIPQSFLSGKTWNFLPPVTQNIIETVRSVGTPLGDITQDINMGIKTGNNKAFVIPQKTHEEFINKNPLLNAILKPVVGGKDVTRLNVRWRKLWLILFPCGFTNSNKPKETNGKKWFEDSYPEVYNHLIPYLTPESGKKSLADRTDQGDYWWELRPCSFYGEYDKFNIIWQEISQEGRYSWEKSFYGLNSSYIMGNSEKYLLLFLNSQLIDFIFSFISPKLVNPRRRFTKQFVEKIPIRVPSEELIPSLEILTDYLLFCKKNNSINEYKVLEKLQNCIVYEMYFHERFFEDQLFPEDDLVVLKEIIHLFEPIEYEKWSDLKQKEIFSNITDEESNDLHRMTKNNEHIIKEFSQKIQDSKTITTRFSLIEGHEWVKNIIAYPWIQLIEEKKA